MQIWRGRACRVRGVILVRPKTLCHCRISRQVSEVVVKREFGDQSVACSESLASPALEFPTLQGKRRAP